MPISGREWFCFWPSGRARLQPVQVSAVVRTPLTFLLCFETDTTDSASPQDLSETDYAPHKERQRATKHNSHYFTFKTHFIGAQRCVEASTRPDG
jgi:hypothetical protein